MRTSHPLLVLALAGVVATAACESVVVDDWGTAGYAQVRGVALSADSTPQASVFIMCGPSAPDFFGGAVSADSTGRFDVTLAAPGLMPLPADGLLQCSFRAPAHAPAVAGADTVVAFSRTRADRPVVDVRLTPH